MIKKRIISPEIKPQIGRPQSSEEAQTRRFIAGKNTSSFFTHVYQQIGQGRVAPQDNGYTYINFPWSEVRHFRPDLVHKRITGFGYTEVKAVSTRTSQPHCSVPQFEDYGFSLLHRINQGDEVPWVDYAFFRYGEWAFNGQHKLENGNLVSALASKTRDLLVVPFNLAIFIFLNSPEQIRNQKSSASTVNERNYWDVRTRTLNALHDSTPITAFEEIMKRSEQMQKATIRRKNKIIEELFLDRLKVRESSSPKMYTEEEKRLETFPITKYRLSDRDYQEWLQHFRKNHKRVFRRLGVRDLYGEWQDYKNDGGEGEIIFSRRINGISEKTSSGTEDCPF